MSATLSSLRVRNLALVEDLLWELSGGFVAITGETGAGKSVLLGALNLLLGERADKSLIRSGADSCAIEAAFDHVSDPRVTRILDDHGAEPCEDGRLIIKRTVALEGPGRQYVNGSPAAIGLLRSLGDLLVDLHGPHDHQSLFSRDQQTRLLDSFAGALETRARFAALRSRLLALEKESAALAAEVEAAARESTLLEGQLREIADANLQSAEEDDLIARQRAAANAQRILELCDQLTATVAESEDSAVSRLTSASRLARELARSDPRGQELVAGIDEAFEVVKDVAIKIASYSSRVEMSPDALGAIEERLDIFETLKRKYGPALGDVLTFQQRGAARLEELRGRRDRCESLAADLAATRREMEACGKELSMARRSVAETLAANVGAGLLELGFSRGGFAILFDAHDQPGPSGFETADFLFAPNPGEPARPLRAIASSGEISRVMLALKSVLSGRDGVPVLVFDEIDANVGGEIAARVGEKMRRLGESHQVLCITHLPQVAAAAATQFVVAKEVVKGRARTVLAETRGPSREGEIARMLGGRTPSALAHARALLEAR